ncbi:MAG: sigma-54-dependent Fis family transcriptional regulator [Chitinispirillaceae bacterium]|nr:sigma-54-dependent Fis family transcriptional regulator [Chitinispirillaceae bacterium]
MEKIKILLVEDDDATRFGYERSLSGAGYSVATAQNLKQGRSVVQNDTFDAVLLDFKLPDGNALDWIPELKAAYPNLPVIVITGKNDVPTAVAAMKSGAENFLIKPVEIENLEACLERAIEVGALRRRDSVRRRLTQNAAPFFGSSGEISALLDHIRVAAESDTPLLIQGETGTGKGVLARWIHEHSGRKTEPFVELNCSCLKGDLLRSELYGHTKGSFTSAVADREGLIEMADKGTLFLDEIGDMDLSVQTQLLKTIEEKTYRRIGENRVRQSDFRLMCASNKDLLGETEKGTFRKDLYYRIHIFPIAVPALRSRREDIGPLAENLLREFGYTRLPLRKEVVTLLQEYAWPGNIRELKNMLERAQLLAQGAELVPGHFPGLDRGVAGQAPDDAMLPLDEVEKQHLVKVVAACKGDKNKASKLLGISLASLYRKLGKHPVPDSI